MTGITGIITGITVYFCLWGLFTATAPVCSCQGAEETKALGPVCKQSTKLLQILALAKWERISQHHGKLPGHLKRDF